MVGARVRLVVIASLCLVHVASATASIPTFYGIGHLPQEARTLAHGVSADGRSVVGECGPSGGLTSAVVWREGLLEPLDDLHGGQGDSIAYGASGDGSIVVGSTIFGGERQAFVHENGVMRGLGDFGGGSVNSVAFAVSADGSTVVGVGSTATVSSQACAWRNDLLISLDDLPGGSTSSAAYGASADGSVIVGSSYGVNGLEAAKWTDSGVVGLGDLPGGNFFSLATAASADGSVIVGLGASANGLRAAMWVGDEILDLGVGKAYAVSADGRIVVGGYHSPVPTFPPAFIWDERSGQRDLRDVLIEDFGLDLSGWTLQRATGISADGRVIVGDGVNPAGYPEGWVAVIPEPSTLGILATLVILFTRGKITLR